MNTVETTEATPVAEKPELLSIETAAEELGLSVRQTRHLCKLGNLGTKIGSRTWVITRDELEVFKAKGRPPVGRPRKAF